MSSRRFLAMATAFGTYFTVAAAVSADEPKRWLAHDMDRPRPPVVTPAPIDNPVPPPSDAIVLFDGSDLSKWRNAEGGPAKWIARDGYMESVPLSGYIYTADSFGDVQLHVEWASPIPPRGKSQARGNSGVFLMGLYEVQVLDSYENETYADGQAAAIYGQYPPMANASLPPGEWQTFDIVFRRPHFQSDGTVSKPATMTVHHNGVLVHDNVKLWGPTAWLERLPMQQHPDKLPLSLQDHGNPVRYRNIWLRELPTSPESTPPTEGNPLIVELSQDELKKFVGPYTNILGDFGTIELHGAQLRLHMRTGQVIDLVPISPTQFALRWTAAKVDFHLNDKDEVTGFTLHIAGDKIPISKKK